MKPLSCLGFCARGDDSAGHWQGWIFNEEQQQPWNNGQAKERPYPQPTLPAGSSIKPPVNCLSSQLSRDYIHPLSPVTFFPCLYWQPVLPSLFFSVSPSLHCNLSCLFPWRVLWTKREQTRRVLLTFFIHHQRNTPKNLFGTHRCQNHPCVPEKSFSPVFPVNTSAYGILTQTSNYLLSFKAKAH